MTLSLTGSIQKKYEYSDYGERSLDSKTEIINNEFGYNGEVHTVDGLQYLRNEFTDAYKKEFKKMVDRARKTMA